MTPELLAAADSLAVPVGRRVRPDQGRPDFGLAKQHQDEGSVRPLKIGFLSSLFGENVRIKSVPETSLALAYFFDILW